MKKFFFLFLALISITSHSQEYKEIDKILGLDETLKNKSEIRIYKRIEITNYRSVFVMSYDSINKNYKINCYEIYLGEPNKIVNIEVDKSKDTELLWLNILISNIQYIPEKMEYFKYKLEMKTLVNEEGEYFIQKSLLTIVDGVSYVIRIKTPNENKTIIYSNPESYLRKFPEVDELNTFINLIKLVEEFMGRKL
ncbi:MAG: hypothetical protein RLZZ500_2639 [Bacteroidota bacterium]